MTIEERKIEIQSLREQGLSYGKIAKIFGLTRQRIHQILKHKKPKKITRSIKKVPPSKNLATLFFSGLSLKGLQGRDLNREKARIRDEHTCQDCKKIWLTGERRFDVHHLDGLCGKKSKGYDRSIDRLVTLCHRCHYNRPEHKVKSDEFGKSVSMGWEKRVINSST